MALRIQHRKGGLFSYIGELRLTINGVITTDYTGWTLLGRMEDHQGVVLPILTAEWVDETTGTLRLRVSAADFLTLRSGFDHAIYVTPVTPAGEPLQPYKITVASQDT